MANEVEAGKVEKKEKSLPAPIDISTEMVRPANWVPNISPEQKVFIDEYFKRKSVGVVASLPLICKWDDCPFKGDCPLYSLKITPTPIGKQCPIEATLVANKVAHFQKEMGVGDQDYTDLTILKEMVMWEMMEVRTLLELGQDPSMSKEAVIGIDSDGEPMTREMANPLIIILEKAGKMKHKLRESLIATREAKDKAKQRKQPDLSDMGINIQKKIEEKRKLMQIAQNPTINIKTEQLHITTLPERPVFKELEAPPPE